MKAEDYAKHSDHSLRIISELDPAVHEALKLPAEYPFLEIGNREGGSGALTLLWISESDPKRAFATVDIIECPALITETAQALGVYHQHFRMEQKDFIKQDVKRWGFVFFDAVHGQQPIEADVRSVASRLPKGAIIAIDDVNEWASEPDFSDVSLERVEYKVDEGTTLNKFNHHILYYRKL